MHLRRENKMRVLDGIVVFSQLLMKIPQLEVMSHHQCALRVFVQPAAQILQATNEGTVVIAR